MKITKITLENFIGIYAGTSKTKIEVDFTNNKNRIIILNGQNGSGKSTFKSLCHPLRGTFDNRSNIILPNELGHSICELILNDGRKCVTEHFYGKKNKSYISIDGVELNESGNIRSFESIAEKELGITGDYFKIGSLGSNVSNFVDLKTTQRKTYINQFIPDVDKYLIAFENAKEKYKNISTEIKIIKGNIEKYSNSKDIDEIKNELEIYKQNKDQYEKELITSRNEENNLEDKYNNYENNIKNLIKLSKLENDSFNDIDSLSLNELAVLLDNTDLEIGDKISELNNNISTIVEKYNLKLGDPFEAVKKLKTKNEKNLDISLTKIETNDTQLKKLEEEQNENLNNITKYKNKLKESNVLTEDSITTIKNELEDFETNIRIIDKENELYENSKEYKEYFNELNSFYIRDTVLEHYKDELNEVVDTINAFIETYEVGVLETFYNGDEELDYNKITEYSEQIEENERIIEEDNKKLYHLQSQKEIFSDSLEKRPDNCKIDSCPFIKSAVNFKTNEESNIDIISDEITRYKVENKHLNEEIDSLTCNYEIYTFKQNCNKRLLKMIPNILANKIINSNYLINDIEIKNVISIINSFYDYRLNVSNKKTLIINKENYIDKIKNYEMSQSIIDEYNSLINKFQNKYNLNKEQMESIINNTKELLELTNKYKTRIKTCDKIIALFEKFNQLNKESEKIKNVCLATKEEFTLANEINEKIKNNVYKEKIKKLNNIIKELNDKISKLSTSIEIIKDNLDRLSKIENEFNNIDVIKKALDPKSGIPLVFINSFLTNISQKTNELLSIAYGDSFKIKFNVSASEFKIEVYKNDGTFLEDISQASQGEQSLTSMSLSLAMIESVIDPNAYNIVNLDEVDATLSTENRRLFIDMLEKQLDILGCEQCFVISHNNEFYNKDVDLILFNGHDCDLDDKDFMKNKNVLADFS